jgi:Ser/Thr protein kinase RdoA (MazF antagonist)
MYYQNENYCLYNYLNGETYSAVEALLNPIVSKLLGNTIAITNKVIATINFSKKFPNKDLYNLVYGYALNRIKEVDSSEEILKVYQQLEQDIKIAVSSLQTQLIHRDAHIHNILFNDNRLTGIIDFEIAEVNVNMFDICYCSTSILSEIFTKEKLRDKWISFVGDLISGYNHINCLSNNEIKSIWYVMLCIQTIFMSYFASNKDIYEVNKKMFLWIYENKNAIENSILQSLKH